MGGGDALKSDWYKVIDNFQAGKIRVLSLDRKYELGSHDVVLVDGEAYCYMMNSIRSWITIESQKELQNPKIKFVKLNGRNNVVLHPYCGRILSYSRSHEDFLDFLETNKSMIHIVD